MFVEHLLDCRHWTGHWSCPWSTPGFSYFLSFKRLIYLTSPYLFTSSPLLLERASTLTRSEPSLPNKYKPSLLFMVSLRPNIAYIISSKLLIQERPIPQGLGPSSCSVEPFTADLDPAPLSSFTSYPGKLWPCWMYATLAYGSMSLHTLYLVYAVLCPGHCLPILILTLGNSYLKIPAQRFLLGRLVVNYLVLLNYPSVASHDTLYHVPAPT